MADYAIHDTTLTGISNVIRKKDGTSALIDPADYADRMNLMGMLEEKTASGSIVTFSDGADDVPLKSCEVALSPSLDGYSSVDVVQTGKNLVDGTNFTRGLPSTTIGASIDTITSSTRYAYIGISVKGSNYTISSVSNDTDYFWNILIYGYTNGVLSVYTNTVVNASKTVDFSSCDYIRLAIGTQSASYQVPTDLTGYGTIQLEVGSTASTYEPYVTPTTHTASLGRTIYGGSVDVVKGEGTDENGNDFTFSPVEINSKLGDNTMWSDGDMSVVYRSSGTVTPIQPTLITKTITANGTYTASDDGVDGYDTVEVSVPSPVIEPILGNNVFVSQNEVSGTDVERTARTFNITKDGKIIFADGSYGYTNTSSNNGYIDIRHNDVSVVKQYLTTDTNTSITIPDIDVENGDTVTVVVGFDSNHSSCYFQLYSAMVMVSEASTPSLLSMSPSEEVNENTEEVEENEQNDIEG